MSSNRNGQQFVRSSLLLKDYKRFKYYCYANLWHSMCERSYGNTSIGTSITSSRRKTVFFSFVTLKFVYNDGSGIERGMDFGYTT